MQNIPILFKLFHIIRVQVIVIKKRHFYIKVIETTGDRKEKSYCSSAKKVFHDLLKINCPHLLVSVSYLQDRGTDVKILGGHLHAPAEECPSLSPAHKPQLKQRLYL